MAWLRWGQSDLYVFRHVDDFFVCMDCPFTKPDWSDFTCREESEMVEHIRKHADAGHDVGGFFDDETEGGSDD